MNKSSSTVRYTVVIVLVSLLIAGCVASALKNKENTTEYSIAKPAKIFFLPDTLREISGLVALDSQRVACVQDENGILFIYHLSEEKIVKQVSFNFDGDYEGIARAGDDIYILRSDGELFEITDYSSESYSIHSYSTGIPSHNNEGLCYDKNNGRLLVACKGKTGKGPEFKDRRSVYSFDLTSKTLGNEPTINFDLAAIREFARQENIAFPEKTKKKNDLPQLSIKFKPSAIGIHPLTSDLYVLSAADHALFIFDLNGRVKKIELLDPLVFNKPEGITFFDNGDMIISNEAQDRHPTLMMFEYRW
ncbi:MAG: hypothetical protein IT223_10680 [Crocinitomicaceae bacterium]|nr:hypothetical protein [Crocinitomicaceae bacterium]